MSVQAPERILDRYEILARLVPDEVGEVFLVRRAGDTGTDALATLTWLWPSLADDPEFGTRFLAHAERCKRATSPTVVVPTHVGEYRGRPYVVHPHVHGVTFRQLLAGLRTNQIRLHPEVTCAIVLQIASALDSVHDTIDAAGQPLGLVHGGLGPDRVLITFDGQVKILGFGIARDYSRPVPTGDGAPDDARRYVAPELLRGDAPDTRADVYSMGAIAWEAIAMRRFVPTPGSHPVSPGSMVPDCPSAFDLVILQALDEDPDRRPLTLDELTHLLSLGVPVATRTSLEKLGLAASVVFAPELERGRSDLSKEVIVALDRARPALDPQAVESLTRPVAPNTPRDFIDDVVQWTRPLLAAKSSAPPRRDSKPVPARKSIGAAGHARPGGTTTTNASAPTKLASTSALSNLNAKVASSAGIRRSAPPPKAPLPTRTASAARTAFAKPEAAAAPVAAAAVARTPLTGSSTAARAPLAGSTTAARAPLAGSTTAARAPVAGSSTASTIAATTTANATAAAATAATATAAAKPAVARKPTMMGVAPDANTNAAPTAAASLSVAATPAARAATPADSATAPRPAAASVPRPAPARKPTMMGVAPDANTPSAATPAATPAAASVPTTVAVTTPTVVGTSVPTPAVVMARTQPDEAVAASPFEAAAPVAPTPGVIAPAPSASVAEARPFVEPAQSTIPLAAAAITAPAPLVAQVAAPTPVAALAPVPEAAPAPLAAPSYAAIAAPMPLAAPNYVGAEVPVPASYPQMAHGAVTAPFAAAPSPPAPFDMGMAKTVPMAAYALPGAPVTNAVPASAPVQPVASHPDVAPKRSYLVPVLSGLLVLSLVAVGALAAQMWKRNADTAPVATTQGPVAAVAPPTQGAAPTTAAPAPPAPAPAPAAIPAILDAGTPPEEDIDASVYDGSVELPTQAVAETAPAAEPAEEPAEEPEPDSRENRRSRTTETRTSSRTSTSSSSSSMRSTSTSMEPGLAFRQRRAVRRTGH